MSVPRVASPRPRRSPARLGVLLLLACACATPIPVERGSEGGRVSEESVASETRRFELWLDAWHERRGFHGFVLVARGDTLLFGQGRGLADPERGEAHSAHTRYDVASLAKPFLATVVLRLAERGELGLDVPVGSYVPELATAPAGRPTLRQLLAHTAGLPDHSHVEGYFERARAGELDRSALLAILREATLAHEPGSAFAYSNYGYTLAALVAERVTGASYPEVLRREVLEPAGLEQTTWNDVRREVAHRAVGYERSFRGELTREPLVDAIADLGSGDVLSTARDLWRFERALSRDALLGPATKLLAFRDHAPVPDDADSARERGYGLGWEVYRSRDPDARLHETQGHGGLSRGFVAVMERDPAEDTFFAVLSNVRPSDDVLNNAPPPDIRRMQADLRRALRGEEVALPRRGLARVFLERYAADGYEAALADLVRLRAERPDEWELDPNALMLAAYEVEALDAAADAVRVIELALREEPDSWLLLEAHGDLLASAERPREALDAYRRAAALRADRPYLRRRIAELAELLGETP